MNVTVILNISVENVDRKLSNICRTPFIIHRKFRKPEPAELVYEDAVPGKCICIMY